MSQSDAEEFITDLMADEDLLEKLEGRLSFDASEQPPEEEVRESMATVVPSLGEQHGYDFTAEEGFDALETLRADLDNEELSDDELERVAGGKDSMKIVTSVISVGIICGAISATAATDGDDSTQCDKALS